MKKIIGIILIVFGILLTAVSGSYIGFLAYTMFSSDEKIGIIGGADGPTAVFLIGNVGIIPFLAVIGLIIGIVCIVISLFLLFKKKK